MYGGYLELQKKLLNGGCAFCVVRGGHTATLLKQQVNIHTPYPALLDVPFLVKNMGSTHRCYRIVDAYEEFECHNLPLVVLGTFALWFGWYGFNPGSTLTMKSGSDGALAAQVAMNTTLAAATGGITVFLLRYVITKKYDVGALCNGILAGLVSITAGCGNMESGSAFATGLIGGFVYTAGSMLLQKLKIDDPVDACPVHGFCGAWGLIATGLFDWGRGIDHYHGWSGFGCMENDDGSCKTGIGGSAIAAQFIMILVIVLWSGCFAALAFSVLKMTGLLRYSEHVEEVGIDSHHHSPPKAYALGPDSQSPSKTYATMTSEQSTVWETHQHVFGWHKPWQCHVMSLWNTIGMWSFP